MMLGNNEQQQQLENGSSGMNVEGGGGGDGGVQLKKGPWTATEDSVLTEYVRKHGEGNWNAVQRNTGLARCGKSCRLRWANHLRPNLKKGAFSPEEERLIVELHAQLGNKWARMAAQQLNHPQSSQSHHSYHSTPSTPTTPNSASFSFHTTHTTPNTPNASHHHHHSYHNHPYPPPCYSRSQTPNPLSPTPPQLSPSLQSSTFPTLSLFDSTNGHHSNHPNSNANMNNPFNMPRTPPILQNPIRFKRIHPDSNNINNNPSNNNQNMENIHNNMNMSYQNNNFSLPFSPQFLRNSSSPMLIPQSTNSNNNNINSNNHNNPFSNNSKLLSHPSFSSIPVNFNAQNSSLYRSPVEKDGFLSNDSGSFSLKPELPSSQALSQQNGNGEMNFDNEKLSVSSSGSGLLEDLLEEAQAMASNYGDGSRRLSGVGSIEDENKREFGGFNQWSDSNSLNLSSGMKAKEENEPGQMNTHEDLSKFLNVIPSMQVPEWYNDCGEASNCQSSVVTDDNIGLEMQQIASLFRGDSNTGHVRSNQGSCSFDNFPGIC
ncbi:hypothetical protein Pint_04109 [Pistacia integerrima]|uniref:Uncharacterized protein n=1 Tax=Pistacia integerrima TaxID=434235 RepID=A0ACC0Z7C3_9ROSI|nr:hypothetical protein Pint_04109 [Pistacia integerrima]